MTTTQPMEGVSMNTYEVEIPLDLSVLDSADAAKLSVVETVARSIVADVDELDEGDASYVSTQVDFDEESLEDAYDDEEVGIATVQTRTQLAIVEDE